MNTNHHKIRQNSIDINSLFQEDGQTQSTTNLPESRISNNNNSKNSNSNISSNNNVQKKEFQQQIINPMVAPNNNKKASQTRIYPLGIYQYTQHCNEIVHMPYAGSGFGIKYQSSFYTHKQQSGCDCFTVQRCTTQEKAISTGGLVILLFTLVTLVAIGLSIYHIYSKRALISQVTAGICVFSFQLIWLFNLISFYVNRFRLKESQWTQWCIDFQIILTIISIPMMLGFATEAREAIIVLAAVISSVQFIVYLFVMHCGMINWFTDIEILQFNGARIGLDNPVFVVDSTFDDSSIELLLNLVNNDLDYLHRLNLQLCQEITEQTSYVSALLNQRSYMINEINGQFAQTFNPDSYNDYQKIVNNAFYQVQFNEGISDSFKREKLTAINDRLTQWKGFDGFVLLKHQLDTLIPPSNLIGINHSEEQTPRRSSVAADESQDNNKNDISQRNLDMSGGQLIID